MSIELALREWDEVDPPHHLAEINLPQWLKWKMNYYSYLVNKKLNTTVSYQMESNELIQHFGQYYTINNILSDNYIMKLIVRLKVVIT